MINDDDSLYETMRHHSKIVLYQMMNLMQLLNNKPYSQKGSQGNCSYSIYLCLNNKDN